MLKRCLLILIAIQTSTVLWVGTALGQCLSSNSINESGSYVLCATSTDTIIIDADNVTLDFNGYSIDASAGSLVHGVVIQPNHHNIMIKNGFINGAHGVLTGISAQGNDNEPLATIIIQNVCINATYTGIALSSCANATINTCRLSNNFCGIALNKTCNSIIEHCTIEGGAYGCYLMNSCFNLFKELNIVSLGGLPFNTSTGFYSAFGSGNSLNACAIQDIQAERAYGIYIDGPESEDRIVGCAINNIISTIVPAQAYGIYMNYSLWDSCTTGTSFPVSCLSWSPDSKFLAFVTPQAAGPLLIVCSVAEKKLNYIDSTILFFDQDTKIAASASGIVWYPDSQRIVVVGQGDDQSYPDNKHVFANMYAFNAGHINEAASYTFSYKNLGIMFTDICLVPTTSCFVLSGYRQYDSSTLNSNMIYQTYQFDTTGTFNFGAITEFPLDSKEGIMMGVDATVNAANKFVYVAFGGAYMKGPAQYAGIYVFKFADGSLTKISNGDLFTSWRLGYSMVNKVRWADGGRLLAAVGVQNNDGYHNDGGLRIDGVSCDPTGKPFFPDLYENKNLGKEINDAAWLSTYRLAYGYKENDTSSMPVGEFRGPQVFEKRVGLLSNGLSSTNGYINALSWSPDRARFAYGTEKNIFLASTPSQCLIRGNLVTGVHGVGIYDTSGCNIIIQNNAYNNTTNYNANNNTNIAQSSGSVSLAANVEFGS